MAAYNKFNVFVLDEAQKVHNLGADALTIALSNVAPVATNALLSDITEISYTNLSARVPTITSSTQTGGTYKLVLATLVLTASGAVATFRYVILYNATPTSPLKPLIAWFDYGSAVTMANLETFTIGFDGTNGVLQIV
jgi:hypothetical protein